MLTAVWAITLLAVGYVLWLALEYGIHRILGHTLNTRIRDLHLEHHQRPHEYELNPRWTMIGVLLVIVAQGEGWGWCSITIGLLCGYWLYELIHWRLHHSHSPSLAVLRLRHRMHHRHPHSNFGVSTHALDVLCGTDLPQ